MSGSKQINRRARGRSLSPPIAAQARRRRAEFARAMALSHFSERWGHRYAGAATLSALRFCERSTP
jgi:hypothetical protein